MTDDRKRLKAAGMPPDKIREIAGWVDLGRKVVVSKKRGNGISEIFHMEAETGSLEVLEL